MVKNDGVHFVVIAVPQGQGLGVGEKGTAGVHVDLSGFFVIEGAAVFFRLLKFHFVVFKPAAGGILKGNPDGRMGAEAVGHLPVAIVFHLHGEGNAVFQDGVGGTKGEAEGIQLQGLLVLGEGEDGGVAFGFFHCPFVVSGEAVGIHAVGLAVKVGGSVPQIAGEGEKEGGNASPISWVAVPEVVVSAGGEAPQLCPVGGDHGGGTVAFFDREVHNVAPFLNSFFIIQQEGLLVNRAGAPYRTRRRRRGQSRKRLCFQSRSADSSRAFPPYR